MCFSTEADLVAGIALLPVGTLALRQLVESLMWAGADGDVSPVQGHAATVYVIFGLAVLPTS